MYIHIYRASTTGGPTAGGVDGNQVSEAGAETNPIVNPTALSVLSPAESIAIPLALRCDTGYNTSGNVTVAPVGTSLADWALSLDGVTWLAYGATLTITTAITTVNTLFYAKCKSVLNEAVQNDTTVSFQIVGNAVAV